MIQMIPRHGVTKAANKVLDFLLPPRCAVCDCLWKTPPLCLHCNPLNDVSAQLICMKETHSAASLCQNCGERGRSLSPNALCAICTLLPLPIDQIFSVWSYTGLIVPAIKAYKYSHALSLQKFFGAVLTVAYHRVFGPHAVHDRIVPIPSSLDIMRRRGFHHTRHLGVCLAKDLSLPLSPFVLESHNIRAPQVKLQPADRLQNMAGAFRIGSQAIRGERILLLDDILTTGATIFEAAKVLGNAGARVDALTIARSPHFLRYRLGFLKLAQIHKRC